MGRVRLVMAELNGLSNKLLKWSYSYLRSSDILSSVIVKYVMQPDSIGIDSQPSSTSGTWILDNPYLIDL